MFRGPLVMLGYWGNEAKTRDTIEPDGWMHTGDLGSMDEDGSIYIVDRLKDLIITCGFNVYPAEIERVLAAHPVGGARRGRPPARSAQGRDRQGLRDPEGGREGGCGGADGALPREPRRLQVPPQDPVRLRPAAHELRQDHAA